jgi:DNA recombination-mediator protein A
VSAKEKTVAAFGTGMDVMDPKANSRLAAQILSLGGALASEFPLGTFAAPQSFPIRIRNRIISGMPFAVLVVEAAEYSMRIRPAVHSSRAATLRRVRERDQQEFVGPEHPHQTGRPPGRHVERRWGGTPC